MDTGSVYEKFLNSLKKINGDSLQRRKSEELKLIDWFAHSVLNSLSTHIAILDDRGFIIQTNQAWREFATKNSVGIRPSSIGVNYLELCDSARGDSAQGAREVARGIREVISDKMEEFVMDYPLMTSKGKRWFYMRAARLTGPEPMRLVISHEDVTPLKRAEEVCIRHETELEIQKRSLEEANTALKVLLKRGEEDRKELEEKVVSNVQQLVTTYVIKMKETSLDARQRQYMEIIESNLNEVVSPFARSLSSDFFHLTPKEIEVANLVKIGKTTKEIAEIMSSSASVINFHRKNIRKKMGINKKKINLQAYLMNI